MRKTLGVFVLALLLTGSANAGIMANESPAPPSQPAVQETITDGDMSAGATAPTTDGIIQNDAAATFIQVILNLLVLS
jgi:hypothetical protein